MDFAVRAFSFYIGDIVPQKIRLVWFDAACVERKRQT
jgi:hypothetical protein